MSVSMLLSPLETQILDDHIQNCAAYVNSAAGVVLAAPAPLIDVGINNIRIKNENENELALTEPKLCKPTLRTFNVRMPQPIAKEEHLALTGDARALGEWKLASCVTMQRVNDIEWTTSVMLQACRHVEYRYFIYVEDDLGRKQIRRWETDFKPRKLMAGADGTGADKLDDEFGKVTMSGNGNEELYRVHRGWLTHETILQLKFNGEKMFQVHDIEQFDPEHLQIKLMHNGNAGRASAGLHIEYTKQISGQSQLTMQPEQGVPYTKGDILIFHITIPMLWLKSTEYENDFILEFYNSQNHKLVGTGSLLGSQLTGSEGMVNLSIKDSKETNLTIARLSLPYVLVQPYQNSPLDFKTTYAHYWPKSWPNLHVGHRGNGKSFIANAPKERENTIGSFLSAYNSHADMIELDVHLTLDGVPIIYHDFGLWTAPQDKLIESAEQLEYVLIKDVYYEKLKSLRIFSLIDSKVVEYPSHNSESCLENRIFPTLQEVLQQLPKSLGIDVEIKWPQRRQSGSVEAEQTIDKNFFTDRVLQTVIEYGCGRPLIFSSFDADMCTMLRFKQNIFPVMFLTMGETKKWKPFIDLRTRNFLAAVNNAQAFELAGTAPHAEDFLGDQGIHLIQQARQQGQITVIWGDECNSKERVKYFAEIGATATCYDRADLYMPKEKERAFFDSSALLAEFKDQCRITC